MVLLAGDIGGTKTTLAIFSSSDDVTSPVIQNTFSSSRYHSLEGILRDFLSRISYPVDMACFGVAGPVLEGHATITNLPWDLDELELQGKYMLSRVRLINDLLATATFIPSLNRTDVVTLHEGKPVSGGAIAVIAPGTGLGEAFLVWDGDNYRAHASEGGHCDFAPSTPSEIELLRYLQGRMDHVSYERVCSGQGLRQIYSFFHDFIGITEEHAQISKEISEADDPTPIIVRAGIGKVHCELCVKTLNTFLEILGAEAGNLALKVLATNGIYLAGGIPVHVLPALQGGGFTKALKAKGRMTGLLSSVPVHVVTNPNIALYGAAKLGFEMMEKGQYSQER